MLHRQLAESSECVHFFPSAWGTMRAMTRPQKVLLILIGMGLAALIFWSRCPPDVCRALHIRTYTITSLDDYREFLRDEGAFASAHHVRAVQPNCDDLRAQAVEALKTARLDLKISQPASPSPDTGVPVEVWHHERLLHVSMNPSPSLPSLDDWTVKVRESLLQYIEEELPFLPPLFGGVVVHVHKRQIPLVLFSDRPCVKD
jgi:hypothetical protein